LNAQIATDFSGGMVRDNPEINKRVADMTALGRAGVISGPMSFHMSVKSCNTPTSGSRVTHPVHSIAHLNIVNAG
jgi:hypothetical protein